MRIITRSLVQNFMNNEVEMKRNNYARNRINRNVYHYTYKSGKRLIHSTVIKNDRLANLIQMIKVK